MVKKIYFSVLLAALLCTSGLQFSFAQTAKQTPQTAAAKPKRNVVDFFKILPNKYVGNLSLAVRQKRLKDFGTTDIPKGYLEIIGQDEKQPSVYVAIFKKDDGDYLVTTAFGTYAENAKYSYYLLEYDGKKWTDVSKKVLPANFKFSDYGDYYGCQLPRFDRTINCRNQDDGGLVYLGWTGKEFVIE